MNGLLLTAQSSGFEVPWLSLLIALPLVGAMVMALFPAEQRGLHKGTALFLMLAELGLSVPLVTRFQSDYRAFQFVEQHDWIEQWGIQYLVGLDGISLWLVMLTTLLGPIMVASSFKAVEKHHKEYYISLLVLESAVIGALVALDTFLFYIFWEVMLIPMFLLIGVWGGKNRVYATVKFFLFTLVGSLLMLVAILYVYFKTNTITADGTNSFALSALLAVDLTSAEQTWLFLAFGLAFAIKVPMFPLHTWLPDAHTEAPTAGSVVLAAVLLKMGTYGLVRYAMPMFPLGMLKMAPYMAILAVIGIVYGALICIYICKPKEKDSFFRAMWSSSAGEGADEDVKRLIAYSSVSHLGFVVLGLAALTPQGVEGGVLQMLAHGISTGGLFLCIGILYERRHTRQITEYGGLTSQVPIFAFFFLIIVLSSAGLPGLNGFVGEFLVLMGTFTSAVIPGRILTVVAATGVILGAVYLLWMFQRVMFGPLNNPKNRTMKDMNLREIAYLTPVVLLCFVMGVFPNLFLDHVRPSVHEFFRIFNAKVERDRSADREATARELQAALSSMPGGDRLVLIEETPGESLESVGTVVLGDADDAGTRLRLAVDAEGRLSWMER